MKNLSLLARYGFIALLALAQADAALAASAPPMGVAISFAVLGGSTVTNSGNTTINGDLGISPGNTITGFPSPGTVNGTIQQTNAAAANAQTAANTAFTALSQTCDTTYPAGNMELAGLTLPPGVYCSTSSFTLTGTLTLDAGGNPNAIWIFIMPASTLTTAIGSLVQVINGGQNCNVFWQVGSTATLGINTILAGNILALTNITLNTSAIVSGRVLALNGAVSLDTNTVSVCSLLPNITVLKSVQAYSDPINGVSNPKAIPGSFMLYTILVTNNGSGTVDSNTTVITDQIPAFSELFVGDINGAGSGPVLFTDGATASGLNYNFTSLASATDNLLFSNDSAVSYAYSPTADANQCDTTTTHLKIALNGTFSASNGTSHPSFSVQFKVRVK